MRIAVLREQQPDEARVGLVPESVKKLTGQKLEVAVESGAGTRAGFLDAEFQAAGARIESDRNALLASADLLVCINRPEERDLRRMKQGAVAVGFFRPLDEPAALAPALEQGLTLFALELVPRITRAQAMDTLSSMATVAGYKAVLLAASHLPRMFPLLMTAAGTIPPARVLVLGAGVAGLQAIATARRLGAVVEAYDVRAAAGEQVRSLGAKFLEVDLGGMQTEDAGGYARELSEEALERGRQLIAKHAAQSDVIITTAQVPGKRAPLLVTEAAVRAMRPGSIIIDLAGSTGGNCALTHPGETYQADGVTIMSPLNLPATVPGHASQLFSRNITSFLALLAKDGAPTMDLNDEILKGACVTHQGQAVNPRVAIAPAGKAG